MLKNIVATDTDDKMSSRSKLRVCAVQGTKKTLYFSEII